MFSEDEDGEVSFCFVGGTTLDDSATDDVEELHENVWFKLKPPKRSGGLYHPFVTARQIDLVRALLTGKNNLRTEGKSAEETISQTRRKPPRRQVSSKEVRVSLAKKKSSVKYLDEIVRQYSF